MRFLGGSLSKLAKSLLTENDYDSFLEKYGKEWNLLTRKQVFPYRFLTDLESLKYEGLVPKGEFGSRLGEGEVYESTPGGVDIKPISDEDYAHYKEVMHKFGCKTFGEYVKLYCESDVELLSLIFEKFIKRSMNEYKIDPSQSYTAAGFFWEAMLRFTNVKLELLTDPRMCTFCERDIRGGVSVVCNRFANANNKYLKDYDPEKESSHIIELDANGLYAACELDPLPVGEFRWLSPLKLCEIEKRVRKGHPLTLDKGAILSVDLDYPESLHKLHSDYPLAPESIIVNGVRKLTPNLWGKREYVLTYEALLYYLQQGLELKKVHEGIAFKKEAFLKPFVEHNLLRRKECTMSGDKFGVEFYKLANNCSVFGKTFESVRNRCNVHIFGAGETETFHRLVKQPHFDGAYVIPGSKMLVAKMKRIKVRLNKPIYLGLCILDKSKLVMAKFHYGHMLKNRARKVPSFCFRIQIV